MGRAYYHWQDCEEFQAGMWRNVSGPLRETFVAETAALMAAPDRFLTSMREVIAQWPRSTERAMTNPTLNHRAWFGHAGCFLVTGSPEDCTRLGWHRLTIPQQVVANEMADRAIQEWRQVQDGRLLDGQITIDEVLTDA